MKLSWTMALIGYIISTSACNSHSAPTANTVINTPAIAYSIADSILRIRDPFIFADSKTGLYYMPASNKPGFKLYSSKDLKSWKDHGNVFNSTAGFWGKNDFWAPDLYEYGGKYYIFSTFSAPGINRGTSLLVADKITGPYAPLVNNAVTPVDWMALDGALYVDPDNQPWIIYCHEWLQVKDGEIAAQQLSADLTKTVGAPKVLFRASEAPWTGSITAKNVTGYVTDAPFLYKTKTNELIMLWSSFTKSGRYAIGVARSESGRLDGKWVHDQLPLNDDDGGHAMLFTDFAGQLRISYHAPNSKSERLVIRSVTETNGKLTLED